MGPNDASGVVWALGEFFLFFLRFFLTLTKVIVYIQSLMVKYMIEWAETTKTGPDDESGP